MYQRLNSFKLPQHFRGRSAFVVQLWWIVQATLFSMSPQFMYSWRNFLLRLFGAKIGKGVIVRPSVRTTYPWNLSVGDYSWIGDHVELYTLGEINIGNNAVISQKSYLCTGSHDFLSEKFDIFARTIVIEDEAWVATDVFIAPGVTIGMGALVGARSSVFNNMPPGMICTGSPASPIKKR
ncbi:putative colanic acid biosynthesis acetyltransferase [Neptuniibacter sp. UBA6509]|uniref:putative colanic acid biosynthesis acetyltransferase n=1 Tax=Neptuniibacter sp. UBA6509 TaxID=1946976 RepID=UPI0025FFA159|nr:putative colanic acid biosynthesis acetyltransferase [Neptuniibacter sp. UBA6509]|tara:strand:- start:3954 stop:4493 length:540 start_codon:yes stop_codon:yes gene_type:complete